MSDFNLPLFFSPMKRSKIPTVAVVFNTDAIFAP